jgi:Autotransporter beta-domain
MAATDTNAVTVASGDTVSWTGAGVVSHDSAVAGTDSGSTTNGSRLFSAAGTNNFSSGAGGTTLSCTLASSTNAGSSGGNLGGNSQTGATNTGVGNNSQSRFGDGGDNTVSQNSIFISTSNMGSGRLEQADWNAWISAEARSYSGGLSGGSFDVVVGVDRLITPDFLVGGLLAYGRIAITDGTTPASANSPALGAYFGKRMGDDLILDGFASFAKPLNNTDGGRFTSTRVSAGLTLTGKTQWQGQELRPFVYAKGFNETQPSYLNGLAVNIAANTITSYSVSAGARMNFTGTGNALVPYVSVAMDYRSSSSTANGTDRYFYPRVGFGVAGQLADGFLNLDIDFGKSRSDTFDSGVKVNWLFTF